MELCESQKFFIGFGIAVIGILIGLSALILQWRKNRREKKVQAPILITYRFGRSSLQEFHFWFKNFGQTVAKSIKINYTIEDLGEVIIAEKGFSLSDYKTTLASTDKDAVTFKWTSEKPITEAYHGIVHVRITYECDFYKPKPIPYPIVIKDGEIYEG